MKLKFIIEVDAEPNEDPLDVAESIRDALEDGESYIFEGVVVTPFKE